MKSIMNAICCLIFAHLSLGHIDRIYDDVVVIEYKQGGELKFIDIPLAGPIKACCTPKEGQRVYFNEKEIIFCLDK